MLNMKTANTTPSEPISAIFRAEFKKFFFCFKSDTNQTTLRKQSNQLTNVARKRSRPNLLAV